MPPKASKTASKAKITATLASKSKSKGGLKTPKRMKKNIPLREGITKGAIRRLARRGGVKRIAQEVYQAIRNQLDCFLKNVVRDSISFTMHGQRKTVTAVDVVYALKRQGKTIYGF